MRRFETSVCIELIIVKHKVECAVAQRPSRRVKVEFGNCVRWMPGGLPVLCVKSKSIKSLCKRGCLQLFVNVCFAENAGVMHCDHGPISEYALRRISIRSDVCWTMRYCSPSYSISIAAS